MTPQGCAHMSNSLQLEAHACRCTKRAATVVHLARTLYLQAGHHNTACVHACLLAQPCTATMLKPGIQRHWSLQAFILPRECDEKVYCNSMKEAARETDDRGPHNRFPVANASAAGCIIDLCTNHTCCLSPAFL